ncbi:hypothetical protein GCM10027039_30260 [Terrabacter koreensis]
MKLRLRSRRAVVALVLSVATLLGGGAAAAWAIDIPSGNDCMVPPDPERPNIGTAGDWDAGPSKPTPGNPFAAPMAGKPQPTIYDTYGYGGLHVQRADPGCNPVPSWSDTENSWANGLLDWTEGAVALSVMLYRAAMSSPLGVVFEPLQEGLRSMLGSAIFVPLVGVVFIGTALLLAFRAARAKVGETASILAKSTLILTVGMFTVLMAVPLGNAVDKGMTTLISSAANTGVLEGSVNPSDALGGTAHNSLLYNTWLQMTFGSGKQNAAAAKEFGGPLFMASTFSRDEQARIDKDPSIAGDLSDQKREDYKEVLTEIKGKYPQPYEYVAGNHTGEQLSFALVAFLAAVVSLLFIVVALLKLIYAMAVTRIMVGIFPAVATAAVFPRFQHLALNVFGIMWDAIVKALYFGLAVVVFVGFGIGGILSPATTMHPLLKLIALAVATYVAWRVAKRLGIANDLQKLRRMGRRFPDDVREPLGVDEVEEVRPSGERRVRKPQNAQELFDGTDSPADYPRRGSDASATRIRQEYVMTGVRDVPRTTPPEALHLPADAASRGMSKAAAKGAASNAAVVGIGTVVSGGTATIPLLAGAAAKGAAGGAAGHALQRKGGANAPSRVVEPSAIYHPSTTSTVGPAEAAQTRVVAGKRVYDIYQAAGGKA